MNIEYFHDHESISRRGIAMVKEEIHRKKDLLLCAATGKSPYKIYEGMVRESDRNKQLFRDLRIIKLDEWWAIPVGSEGTCENYLRKRLVAPLSIPENRYLSFKSDATDPESECKRISSLLFSLGPIDLAILGLGKNGHIGLNEPGTYLQPYSHLVTLSEQSQQHAMTEHMDERPTYGMTLGIKEILSSKKIILIVSGADKQVATKTLFSGVITTECPASFLWLHDHVHCLLLNS